jgi:hypothetical protein
MYDNSIRGGILLTVDQGWERTLLRVFLFGVLSPVSGVYLTGPPHLTSRENKGNDRTDGVNYDTSLFGTSSGSDALTSVLSSLFVYGSFSRK